MLDVKNKTILLVEDQILVSLNEKKTLEKEGFHVLLASNGEEAIQIVTKNLSTIDLILMDIDLGDDIDGTLVANKILKIRELPIVFLTAHLDKALIEKTEKVASYGYVIKSSEINILLNAIKMALRLFNLKQEMQVHIDEINELYNHAPCGYQTLDESGTILRMNQTLLDWLGYSAEEVIGKIKLTDLVNPDNIDLFEYDLVHAINKGKIHNLELVFHKKGGVLLPVLFTSEAIYDKLGIYQQTRSIVTDYTEKLLADYALKRTNHELEVHQIELELQNEQLRLTNDSDKFASEKYSILYEYSPNAFLLLDKLGNIDEINLSAASLIGKSKEKLINQNLQLYLTFDSLPKFGKFLEKVFQGGVGHTCDLHIRLDELNSLHINLRNVSEHHVNNCFMLILDISKIIEIESKIETLLPEVA
jgi:PAS domain S-box-containing protein